MRLPATEGQNTSSGGAGQGRPGRLTTHTRSVTQTYIWTLINTLTHIHTRAHKHTHAHSHPNTHTTYTVIHTRTYTHHTTQNTHTHTHTHVHTRTHIHADAYADTRTHRRTLFTRVLCAISILQSFLLAISRSSRRSNSSAPLNSLIITGRLVKCAPSTP